MTDPDFVDELVAITVIKDGTVAGGPELFPGSLFQLPLHDGAVELSELAQPLKADGAEP